MIMFARQKVMSNTKDTTYKAYMENVEPAVNWVTDSYKVIGNPAQGIETSSTDYISDLMVAGMKTDDPDKVKKLLLDKGYTPYDVDLNQGTNGSKIYLGYKTTKNKKEAIKDLYIHDSYPDSYTFRNKNFSLCPFVGDDSFVSDKGNLNYGATYKSIILLMDHRTYVKV